MIEGLYVHKNSKDDFWVYRDYFKNHCEQVLPEFYNTLAKDFPDSTFFLYGSRSMMWCNNKESDWDFAIDQEDPVIPHLHMYGFKRKEDNGDYGDGYTYAVYERSYGEDKVQIVVKKSLIIFELVWGQLPETYWSDYINKRSPSYLGKEVVHHTLSIMYSLAEHVKYSLKTDVREFM